MNHLEPEIIKHFAEDEAYQKTHNDEMNKLNDTISVIHEKLDDLISRTSPIVEQFNGLKFTGKLIIKIFAFMMAIVGMAIALRNLFWKAP